MKVRMRNALALLGFGMLVVPAGPSAADGSDAAGSAYPSPRLTISAGAEYSTGTYGGEADIDDVYVPLTGNVDLGRFAFRLTVPYLSVSAPEGTTIVGPGGEPVPGTGERVTNSGLGDVLASVTWYDVAYSRRMNVALDLVGGVKLGTADADKGLGTGENDYSARADVLKFLDRLTLIGSLGYRVRGDTADTDFEDGMTASAGLTYKFDPRLRGGLFFDYRESAFSGNDPIREVSGFLSRKLSGSLRMQAYLVAGFTDSSLDWGGGIRVSVSPGNRRAD